MPSRTPDGVEEAAGEPGAGEAARQRGAPKAAAPRAPDEGPRLASDEEGLLACVHCGFCLTACPTYRVLGDENDSPRGRLYLMRALVEGRVQAEGAFSTHIDRCLGCRACETACPAGVEYGALLELAREDRARRGAGLDLGTRILLWILRSPLRAGLFFRAGRWLRASGVAGLLGRLLSGRAGLAMRLLAATEPGESGAGEESPARGSAGAMSGGEAGSGTASGGEAGSAAPRGERRRRGAAGAPAPTYALLEGCVMDGLFGHVNAATRRVLRACGYRERPAAGQGCCGALHAHAGLSGTARELARQNLRAFEESEAEFVAVNSAGCSAAMKEYPRWLSGDPVLAARAGELADRVRDVTELVEEAPDEPEAHLEGRAAYDAPCHLLHGQGIRQPPLRALARIRGLEAEPLPSSDDCCGGAGIYNLLRPELSMDVLRSKLDEAEAGGYRWVATGNPGCLMQVGAGLLERGSACRAVHPVQLLDRAVRRARREGGPDQES